MFDVIVVGARCSGAATAMLLSRRGFRVLLVDRMTFPSDTLSTLYIHPPGVALLREWGVLPAVVASGCPRLDRSRYEVGGVRLDSGPFSGDASYAPRRRVLDQILVDAAVAAGAEFRAGCRVTGPVWAGDRVAGVRMRPDGGPERVERAHLVVGADGMRSVVARSVSAPVEVSDPLATCVWYSVWDGVPAQFETYERTGNWIAVIPTNHGLTVVATYFPQERFAAVRHDPLVGHHEAVRLTAPHLDERLRHGSRVERLRGSGEQRNFFRRAIGPGWALVGDASVHKDSITARGITDAFVHADLLGRAVPEDLADPVALDRALTGYARDRDRAMAGPYRNALALARLQVTGSRLAMLRAISESTELTALYFSVVAGLRPMDDLLVPELLTRL